MGGILQVDTIQNNNATTLITQTNSTTLTFGVTGQNIVIPSGVTFNTASATVTLPTTIKVDTIQNTNSTNLITQTNVTTITFGATSQTISVPSVASFNSTIGVGGATPSTSGAGITFPATQSASTDANTLDDYEEGTFSPIISTGFTGTPVYSSTDNFGRYTKIGNRVYVHASVKIDSGITAAATGLQYGGLPFTSLNVAQTPGGFYFIYNSSWASGGTASFYMTMNANDTKFFITGTNGIGVNGNNASLTLQGTVFNYSGFYIV